MSLSLAQLDKGIDMLVENAEQLLNESEALFNIGGHPRAYALAHLAREELSKALMLQATGIRILARRPVNWKLLMRRLRDHKAKLRLDSIEHLLKLNACDQADIGEVPYKAVATRVEQLNDLKNVAMYVGFVQGTFRLPANEIDREEAKQTVSTARQRLSQVKAQCLRLPRLSQREIGSLEQLPDVDTIARHMTNEAFAELAVAYREVLNALAMENGE